MPLIVASLIIKRNTNENNKIINYSNGGFSSDAIM